MYKKMKQQRILTAPFILILLLIGSFILLSRQTEKDIKIIGSSCLCKRFAVESYFEYTDEDVKLLGDFMHVEMILASQFCSLDNVSFEDLQYAYMLVGSVVLHRLESRIWGKTIEQVIYFPHQYYIFEDMDIMDNIDTPPEVYEWAKELLQYGPKGPDGLIYELWFKRGESDPYWKLGELYFYVDNYITKKVKGGKVY